MNYTILQLRGGSTSEHLSGNGTGFIGQAKEVTVDTTDWTLRVHDGKKIGGHRVALSDENISATNILFSDGETLQYKFDSGKLGSDIVSPDSPQTPTTKEPKILTISPSNALSNGSCDITYYIEYENELLGELKYSFSKDNGSTFKDITVKGDNPYTFSVKNLIVGSNICAIKAQHGNIEVTKYFIIEIPNPATDTAPVISDLYTSDITTSSFKVHYKATDKENHSIRNHKISLDNGYSYSETYPMYNDGMYTVEVNGLNHGCTYFCRLKINANGLDSNPYGFQITTLNVNSITNPLLTDGANVYEITYKNGQITPVLCNKNINNAVNEIMLKDNENTYKLTIKNNVLSISNS